MFVKQALRRASLRWPARNEALVIARVDRGKYLCYSCKEIFRKQEVHVDHKSPVVEVSVGFINWDTYIKRLLCEVDELQVLCHSCHASKTMTEDNMREAYRKLKKEKA